METITQSMETWTWTSWRWSLWEVGWLPDRYDPGFSSLTFDLISKLLLFSLQVKVTVFSPWPTQLSTTWTTTCCSCATWSRPSLPNTSHRITALSLGRDPSSTRTTAAPVPDSPTSGAAAAQGAKTCSAHTAPTTKHTVPTPGFLACRRSCRRWRTMMGRRLCWTISWMSSGLWMGDC